MTAEDVIKDELRLLLACFDQEVEHYEIFDVMEDKVSTTWVFHDAIRRLCREGVNDLPVTTTGWRLNSKARRSKEAAAALGLAAQQTLDFIEDFRELWPGMIQFLRVNYCKCAPWIS